MPKVIVKRKDDIRGDLFVALKLVDLWQYGERSDFYDFCLPRNHTVQLMIGPDTVQILNPPWLLLQQVQIWNARIAEAEKRKDEMEIRTLVDVLGFRKEGKVTFSGRRDVEDLRMLVMGTREVDPGVLDGVIDCPEVFGPLCRIKSVWEAVFAGAFMLSFMLSFVADWVNFWDDGLPVE